MSSNINNNLQNFYPNSVGNKLSELSEKTNTDSKTAQVSTQNLSNMNVENPGSSQLPRKRKWEEGALESAMRLVKDTSNINIKDSNGNTLLLLACKAADIDMVRILLQSNVDVNIQDLAGRTAFVVACLNNDLEIVKLLLAHHSTVVNKKVSKIYETNSRESTPLHLACLKGYTKLGKLLIENGADVRAEDEDGNTPLLHACRAGHKELAELLIANGADIKAKDKNNNTLLHFACGQSKWEIVSFLIKSGADVNAENIFGATPLSRAFIGNYYEVAELLIENGAKVNAEYGDGSTPLHLASAKGELKVVELLIKKGADIGKINEDGNTALHLACKQGETKVVELLIKKGADIGAKNNDGSTPLHFACRAHNKELVKFLIEQGADFLAEDINETIPFDDESQKSWIEGLQVDKQSFFSSLMNPMHLVDPKIKQKTKTKIQNISLLMKQDHEGKTLLHLNAFWGDKDIVKLLLDKGAYSVRDNSGKLPIDYAENQGIKEILSEK